MRFLGSKRLEYPRSRDACGEEGSALPAVLIILTVITTIVGAVMAVRLAQFRLVQRDVGAVQAYYAAEAGLQRARVELERDPTWRPVEGRFGNTLTQGTIAPRGPCAAPRAACTVHVKPFGGYLLVSASASVGDMHKTLRAFVGSAAPPAFENAIILGGMATDLTLAAGARVKGGVVLRGGGGKRSGRVSRGTLARETEQGTFRGEVRPVHAERSETAWPAFHTRIPRETLFRLEEVLFEAGPWPSGLPPVGHLAGTATRPARSEEAAFGNDPSGNVGYAHGDDEHRVLRVRDSLRVTARDSALFRAPVSLYVRGNLTVQGPLTLSPGTELIARDTLQIGGAVRGPETLLYGGRQVRLRGWAGGATQVLSRSEVLVDGPTHLKYPSTIYVSGGREARGEMSRLGGIKLGRGAIVDGTLLSPDALRDAVGGRSPGQKGADNMQSVVLEERALLRGALYSAGRARIEGSVYGMVATKQLYYYRSPTRYVNWIAGGQIDRSLLPPGYVAPVGFASEPAVGPVAGSERALRLIRLSEREPPPEPPPRRAGRLLARALQPVSGDTLRQVAIREVWIGGDE